MGVEDCVNAPGDEIYGIYQGSIFRNDFGSREWVNRSRSRSRRVSIPDIAAYHEDADASLRLFFTRSNPNFGLRFFGKNNGEIAIELADRLNETDLRSSLAILSQIEAAFRVDYGQRCKTNKKDAVSKAFIKLYKKNRERVSLEDHILGVWRENEPENMQLLSELKGAFKFRHWLAHGMYWQPNLARKYDYPEIYALADNVLEAFPLLKEA